MTWPPRWTAPHFKEPRARKVERGLRREARVNGENQEKTQVRKRDRFCRFPLCGCKRFQLPLHEVSHQRHKGMGGNPKGDRSVSRVMVLLCSARHKENSFSVDRKTIRWRALTADGAHGPIAWDIDVERLRRAAPTAPMIRLTMADWPTTKWFELARETAPHIYEPQTAAQTVVLAWLRSMEV